MINFYRSAKDETKNMTAENFMLMIMMQSMSSQPVGVQHLLPFILDDFV